MTLDRDLDRRIVLWLDERAVASPPPDLLARSLVRVATTRQRAGWLVGGFGPGRRIVIRRTLVPAWLVAGVVALLALAFVAAGTRLLQLPAVVPPTPSVTSVSTPDASAATQTPTAAALLGGGPILAHTYTGFGDPGPFDVVSINPGTGATTLLGRLPGKSVTGSSSPYTFLRNADLSRVVLDRPLEEPTAAARPFGFTVAAELGKECCPNESMEWQALSPAGDRVAAVHVDSQDKPIEIVVVGLTGKLIARLPIPRGITWGGPLWWAPEGGSLLISGCRPCNKAETPTQKQTAHHAHLYLVPVDGSAWRELLDLDNGQLLGAWSPDGTRLAVERYVCARGSFMPRCDPAEMRDTLSVLDLGTEAETPLWDVSFISEPDWSPDGTRLAFGALDGTYVIDIASGLRTQVATGQSFGANWSPDGLWLVANPEYPGPDLNHAVVSPDGSGVRLSLNGYAGVTW